MNWGREFDWDHARAFLATAETGSLSAAARALGTSQPTLSRQVASLAEALGVTLFERVGRGLVLTETGADIAERLRPMAEAAEAAALAASGQSDAIDGHIRITASEIYAARLLPPVLAKLRRRAPGLTVEIVASNSVTDLRRRDADVAIRNARPEDPALFARKVADDAASFFATPAYLEDLGNPTSLAGFAGAEFLGFSDVETMIGYLTGLGFAVSAEDFPLRTENHLVQLGAALRGLGIVVIPLTVGFAEPRLRRILPDAPVIPYPVWVVAHREVRTSRRVRLVFDLLAEELPGLVATE